MLKSELRKIYFAKQKNLLPQEKIKKSERIAAVFFQYFDLSRIKFLHCFLPIEKFNEIDTKPLFERLWREFPRIETLAPRVDLQAGEIENLKFTSETNLVRNAWQIDEPPGDESVAAEKIDLILVPLLTFDESGYRVGYGKGFYDKFLKNCRTDCLKIGLSYFTPVEKISDAQGFDVPLDFCITPEKIFNTKIRRTQRI